MNDDQNQASAGVASPPGGHEVAGVPIRPAARGAMPGKAQPAPGGECVRPFVNDQLNSRVSERLPGGEWRVRWQSALDPGFPPAFVLQGGDRIVAQGTGRWLLFDLNGTQVHIDNFGPSDIVLDPPSKLLYMADRYGVLQGRYLANGAAAYALPFSGGIEWQRTYFARRGRDFTAVSYQRKMQSHSASVPNAVTVETQDLGDPMSIKNDAVASAHRTGDLFFATPRAWAASSGSDLVVAMQNEIIVSDFGRKMRVRMTDSFDAGPISLDETGRIYALAARNGRYSLWLLTPRGERVFAQDFPPDALISTPPINALPPVVGYDHRVYLVAGSLILCVSPEGTVLWRGSSGGTIAGMVVTPDDELIVSTGTALVAFDTQGTRRVLRDFKSETLVTPPAIVKGGDVLVASGSKLYRLTVHP